MKIQKKIQKNYEMTHDSHRSQSINYFNDISTNDQIEQN